jgi:hypothetical protein
MAGVYAERSQHEAALALVPSRRLVVAETYLPYVIARSSAALGLIDQARNLIDIALEVDSTDQRLLEFRRQLGSK